MKNIDKEHFKTLNILYVEDEEATREEISFFLRKLCGYVKEATNGEEGLKAFEKEHFDMVITDIQMPIMDGLEMVTKLRKIDTHVPIAVTTAFSDTDFLIKAIACGVDKYILKPVDMMELLTVIQKCTRTKALEYKIESYDQYAQFLLQNNAAFMLILHKGDFSYANQELMELFNANSFDSLYQKSLLFYEGDQISQQKEWIKFVKNNPEREFIVTLEKGEKRFFLEYRIFEEIDKSVFLFHEIKEEKDLKKQQTRALAEV